MKAEPLSAHVQVRYDWINSEGRWQADGHSGNASLAPEYADTTRSAIAVALHEVDVRVDRRDARITLQLTLRVDVGSVEEALRLAAAEWSPAGVAEPEPMVAEIPGRVTATYRDGKIEKVSFTPSASDAGYHGPSFTIIDNPESYPDEEDDRPFWGAMTTHLAAGMPIDWEE